MARYLVNHRHNLTFTFKKLGIETKENWYSHITKVVWEQEEYNSSMESRGTNRGTGSGKEAIHNN
jgi:hypothetical protein